MSDATMQSLQTIRALAKEAGCDGDLISPLQSLASPASQSIALTVAGVVNAGKSTVINTLLGRPLLPVSLLPSRVEIAIANETSAAEAFSVGDEGPRPLTELRDAIRRDSTERITIAVNDPWLSAGPLQIIEKPAFDVPHREFATASADLLRDTDVLLLAIDALAPVRSSEAFLIKACRRRGLPLLVLVTKTSGLAEDDRQDALSFVEQYALEIDPATAVIDVDEAGTCGLRAAIEKVVSAIDLDAVRVRQKRFAMLPLLARVRGAAEEGLSARRREEEQTESARRVEEEQQSSERRMWLELEAEMHARRRRLDEQMRTSLAVREAAIVERLVSDLLASSDVKGWWRSELPRRFRHELHAAVDQLSSLTYRGIGEDLQWLRDEVQRRFGWALAIDTDASEIATSTKLSELTEPELSDANAVKVISIVGTSATLIVASAIFAATGALAVAVAGVVAGGLADIYTRVATTSDRTKARTEIEKIVHRTVQSYTTEGASKLAAGYDAILSSVRTARLTMQLERRKAATAPVEADNDRTSWESLLARIGALEAELQA